MPSYSVELGLAAFGSKRSPVASLLAWSRYYFSLSAISFYLDVCEYVTRYKLKDT